MASYVDEKIAKITLDNKSFTSSAQETMTALEKLKSSFKSVSDVKTSDKISKDLNNMSSAVDKSVNKSESLLSKLKGIFKKSTDNIDMSGGSKSVDKMNTDIANKTARTSDILSRLKGIFQKADSGADFQNITASIDKLNSKVAGVDVTPIASAFQSVQIQVQSSISAMDIALGNFITMGIQKVTGFAKQFTRGFVDGYGEYANKMTSIQTIKSNTEAAFGGDVNRQMTQIARTLSDLNEYADQTIYSFEDMTRNIGTFTAAGVDLDKSAVAIKGIANLAAASGSSSQQASTAMYQLSQALASGKVSLMDWNSVVNAGMGGELFKKALMDTAKAMGKNRDETKSFRDSLQDGWLTADVLLETLKKFSENESMIDAATKVKTFSELIDTTKEAIGSGWSDTWEYVFGGLEEAKGLWSGVAGEIGKFLDDNQGRYFDQTLKMERNLGNFRNAVLKTWKDNGGQKAFFDTIQNSVSFLMKSLTSVRSGFRSAFGDYKTVAAGLVDVTKNIANFTKGLKENKEIQSTLNSIGSAVGNTIKTLGMTFGSLFQGLSKGRSGMDGVISSINNIANGITKFMQSIQQSKNIMQGFSNIGQAIGNIFGIFSRVFSIAAKIVIQFFSAFNLGGKTSGFVSFTDILVTITDKIIVFLDWLSQAIDKVGLFKSAGMIIGNAFKFIADAVSGLFDTASGDKSNPLENLFDSMSKGFNSFGKFLTGVASDIVESSKAIADKLTAAFDMIKSGAIKGYEGFKQVFNELKIGDIISGLIGLFALEKWVSMKSGDGFLTKFIDKLKDTFAWFKEDAEGLVEKAGGILDKFGGSVDAFTKMINITSLAIIATGILMLSIAIKMLSELEMEDLSKGIIGLATSTYAMVWAFKALTALTKGFQKGTATTMIAFAAAIMILAKAMKTMSEVDPDKIGVAIQGMVSAMLTLVAGMRMLQGVGGMSANIMQLIALAISMKILASALNDLRKFNPRELTYATISIVNLMVSMAVSTKILNNVVVPLRTVFSLISFAISLKILVSALDDIASINPKRLIEAVGSMVTIMLSLAASIRILNNVKIKISAMITMLAFVLSVKALVKVIEELSRLNPQGLARAMESVSLLMVELVGAVYVLNGAKPNLGGILALLSFSGGVLMLAKSVKEISDLNIPQLKTSMVAVSALMLEVVAASYVINTMKFNLGSMLQMITLTTAIKQLVSSMKDIADMKPDSLKAGMIGISSLMLAMALSVKLINSTSAGIGTAIINMFTIQTFTETIMQIGKSLEQVSKIPWPNLLAATGSLFVVMSMLVGLMAFSDRLNGDIGELATLAAVLYVAGGALAKVAQHDWKSILSASGAISLTILAIVGAMKLLEGSKFSGAGSLLVVSGALLLLSHSISTLAGIGIVQAALGLGVLAANLGLLLGAAALAQVLAPGLMLLSTTLRSLGLSSLLAAASFTVSAIGIAAVTFALAQLARTAPGAINALVAGLITAVVAIGKNAPLLVNSLVRATKEGLRGMREVLPDVVAFGFDFITALLKGLTRALPELVSAAVQFVIAFAKSLVENAIILVQTAIQLVEQLLIGMVQALPQLVGTISTFVIQLLDMLSSELGKNSTKLAESFGNVLKEVVTILTPLVTQFFGPLADAIVSTFAPIFQKIVDVIVSAAPVLVPLIETIGSVIETVANGIVTIVQTIVPYISPILDSITQMINAIAPILISLFQNIATTIQMIAPVAMMLIQGIVVAIQVAGSVINGIVSGIVTIVQVLGITIMGVANAIVGAINGVASVITAVGSVITSIFEGIGSVIQSVGTSIESILNGLGRSFESVGTSIKTALDGVSGVVESVGGAIKSALDGVAGIFDSLGTAALNAGRGLKMAGQGVSEILQYSLGELVSNLGAVADAMGKMSGQSESMGTIGAGFKRIGDGLSSISVYGVAAIVIIQGLANALPTIATSIANVPTQLSAFSTAFQSFTTQLTSGITTAIPAVISGIQSMGNTITQTAMASLTQGLIIGQTFGRSIGTGLSAGIPTAMSGAIAIGNAALSGLRSSMNAGAGMVVGAMFGKSVASGIQASTGAVSGSGRLLAVTAVQGTRGGFQTGARLGTEFGQNLSRGIQGSQGQVVNASRTVATQSVNTVRTAFVPAVTIGTQFSTAIARGISSGTGMAAMAANMVARSAVSGVQGFSGAFQQAGYYFSSGLAQGISSGGSMVVNAAISLASSALRAAKSALDIHSPSRETGKLGKFFTEGFVVGIESLTGQAIKVAKTLAQSTLDAVANTGEEISSVFDNDLNLNPTIVPVVDTSNLSVLDQYDRNFKMGTNSGGLHGRVPELGKPTQSNIVNNSDSKTYNVNLNVETKGEGFNARKAARDIRAELERLDNLDKFNKGVPVY